MKTFLCFIVLSLFFIASNVSPPEKISFGNDTEYVSDFINITDAFCPVEMETIYVPGYAEWPGGAFVGEAITVDSYIINQFLTFNVTRLNRQTCSKNFRGSLINPVARSGTFIA